MINWLQVKSAATLIATAAAKAGRRDEEGQAASLAFIMGRMEELACELGYTVTRVEVAGAGSGSTGVPRGDSRPTTGGVTVLERLADELDRAADQVDERGACSDSMIAQAMREVAACAREANR